MSLALDQLLDARQIWRVRPHQTHTTNGISTGLAALDAGLPHGGWPPSALSEVLLPADGVGELQLVWPALAALAEVKRPVVLVAPPYRAFAPAWQQAGLSLDALQIVEAPPREAAWAAEQCLRSAACSAVLCWPGLTDDRTLRRLQVAAETGQCLGIAFRPARAAENPSPAALRLLIETRSRQVRVLKCRGAVPPAQAFPLR